MWTFCLLLLLNVVSARWTPPQVTVKCETATGLQDGFSTTATFSPSILDEMEVVSVMPSGNSCWMLNISWAINIDNSIAHLTGTRIWVTSLELNEKLDCSYKPRLDKVDIGYNRAWFHYLLRVCKLRSGENYDVEAFNLPIPPFTGSGVIYKKGVSLTAPSKEHPSATVETVMPSTEPSRWTPEVERESTGNLVVSLSCVAGIVALACCVIFYRVYGSFRFSPLPYSTPPATPVSVLVVYPPENPVFQNTVVALAEFLQCSGCRVDIDLWQSGRLAEMGPMRWLAQQANMADKVLIVCPLYYQSLDPSTPSAQLGRLTTVPAAASHDLFPMVLNMVASQLLIPSQMAKFWVLHLGKAQERSDIPVELRACRQFCLMKDMDKLYSQLHSQQGCCGSRRYSTGQGRLFAGKADNEVARRKLRDAVRLLRTQQDLSVSVQMTLLKEVI